MRAFRCWLANEPCKADVTRKFALTQDPDVWEDRLRIDVDFTLPGLAQALKNRRGLVTRHLHENCREWQNAEDFNFKQTFDDELAGVAKGILEQRRRYLAHYAAVSTGQVPFDDEVCFPPPASSLVSRMLSEAASTLPDMGERLVAVPLFFASEYFRAVPGARVSALFWATIAREIHSGRKPDRFPKSSMYNDIDVVAMYSPFLRCDVC
jgi:hypothetical protein